MVYRTENAMQKSVKRSYKLTLSEGQSNIATVVALVATLAVWAVTGLFWVWCLVLYCAFWLLLAFLLGDLKRVDN